MGTDLAANTEAQRRLYGAPLRDLVTGVLTSLELTQGRLADVLGVSAPMLSQLMSGHRVKIGDPAVVQRLQSLLALCGDSTPLSPEERAARLRDIRGSRCALLVASEGKTAHEVVLQELRARATRDELDAASQRVQTPALADLLREAARANG
ncbi:hypothetical protein [Gephyromycinifex aptenodytis]|uniref:hypothetical protein n=1 Tax=Gephyromycinifex aptenodytis TaxID=2716227 RepID=UPI0014469863|nr:hypothetical protein [Gephyromycinifex aptenodytis]